MNPPIFYGSKVDEDLQEFIDEVYKIHLAIGLTTSEKYELSTYKLKGVAQIWYVHWRDNRPWRCGQLTWEIFKKAFLDRFFPRDTRKEKVVVFINLPQGRRSVNDYSLEFIICQSMLPFWFTILETK